MIYKLNSVMRFRIKEICTMLAFLSFFSTGFAQNKTEAPKLNPWQIADTKSLPRLDVPVTEKNSLLYDLGNGAILRVPKVLFSDALIPKDPKQAVKADRISLSFQYPDMVPSSYPSYLDINIAKDSGRYILQADRFPVHIVWLFYQTQQLRNPEAQKLGSEPDSRPKQILIDQNAGIREGAGFLKLTYIPPTIVASIYKGIEEVKFGQWDKAGREKRLRDAKENGYDFDKLVGYYYVEKAGSPYELYLHCENPDIPDSHECKAYVYIKSNHLQYRMLFPPEAIAHADDLILAINKTIESWNKKN